MKTDTLTLGYKIRKFLGLTLFEDACNEVTDEDIKNFKKDPDIKKSNDWVTPTSFTGM